MGDILTWASLGTSAGVSAAVMLLTQVVKGYLPKVDPKWIALALSALVTVGRQVAAGAYGVDTVILAVLNALLTAGTAIGAYEGAKGVFGGKDGD